MLADLLDVATMEAGKLVIQPAPTEIVALVRSAVELNGIVAEARSVHLAFEASTPSVELQLDAARVTRVLMNVMSNAIKFTPEGGRVTTSVTRLAHHVEITVADTGPGIPAAQLETIFEKFQRTAIALSKPGYGLGLHIAHAIVDAHRGRIWAENNEHHGATFFVRFPIEA